MIRVRADQPVEEEVGPDDEQVRMGKQMARRDWVRFGRPLEMLGMVLWWSIKYKVLTGLGKSDEAVPVIGGSGFSDSDHVRSAQLCSTYSVPPCPEMKTENQHNQSLCNRAADNSSMPPTAL